MQSLQANVSGTLYRDREGLLLDRLQKVRQVPVLPRGLPLQGDQHKA